MTKAKIEDLKIQGVSKHGEGLRNINEQRWKKSKPKVEAVKLDYLIWDTGGSGFFLKR
jgi:hypothetical protein